jgi:signal transduction histidine kinase/ActR/RegA family two-component response regulator
MYCPLDFSSFVVLVVFLRDRRVKKEEVEFAIELRDCTIREPLPVSRPMTSAPNDSTARIEALERYEILDTPPEEEFDDITRLIARICDAPIAVINFIDRDRQWFKSEIGLGLRQTSLEVSVCSQAILQPELFIVPDTLMDTRFANNPLVTGWPHLRFYAGAPLETSDGFRIGTLCVSDYRPRGLLDTQKEALRTLARQVMVLLELRRSAKLIEQASRSVRTVDHERDEFLATLSHELRTPLTPVLMTSYALLLDDTLTKSQRTDIESIRTNVELETKMIDDLLDHARMTNDTLKLRREPVDVHYLLERAEQIARGAGASMPIEKVLRATNTRVMGDAARLEQAFWNVLKNAVKFTPTNGCIAVITSNPQPESLRIRFIDTGIGIEPEVLPRLFSGYETGRRERGGLGGLGLGLPIAKEIVAMHEGSIQASSAGHNKGATFTIDLPVLPAAVATPGFAPEKITVAARGLRILVVEDHESTAQIMARLLQRAGHEVEVAYSVAGAKGIFNRRDFDLVISDLGLPDGNGLDLFRYMNERQPVEGIALSGYGMQDDIQASLAAGFREHVVKPVDWPKLEAIVDHAAMRLHPAQNGQSSDAPFTLRVI